MLSCVITRNHCAALMNMYIKVGALLWTPGTNIHHSPCFVMFFFMAMMPFCVQLAHHKLGHLQVPVDFTMTCNLKIISINQYLHSSFAIQFAIIVNILYWIQNLWLWWLWYQITAFVLKIPCANIKQNIMLISVRIAE